MAQPGGAQLQPGGAQGARFQGIRTLGKGAHGFVQLAIDHKCDGQQVAIKYIPRRVHMACSGRGDPVVLIVTGHHRRGETASFYKYVLREVLHHQQLSLCKHPHIVEFHEVFLTPRYLGVVMEFIDGQDLQAYLVKAGGTLAEDVARFVFQQLVVAVDFIHKKGKVNRDIKLANVLVVDSGSLPLVKMCDFGFSKDKFDDSAPQTQIGTALFTAPEVFLNVQGHVYEGEAVDVWSCGVVLHMLLFGRHPFLSPADMALGQAEQMVKLIENTVKGKLHVPEAAEGSSAADMLRRILVPSPKQRYGIKDILVHPWFQVSMACLNAPGLSCLFLESGGFWDAFKDGVRHHGTFTMKQVTWAFKNAKVSPEVMRDPEVKAAMEATDLKAWFRRLPWKEGDSPLTLAPDYERYIFDDWRSDTFTEKWQQCGLYAKGFLHQFADVPVMIICSWYDPYIGAMTDMFTGLSASKQGPIKMILGPWTHGDHGKTYAGDVDFGPQSTFDRNVAPTFHGARLQWFDEHLQERMPGSSPAAGRSPGASPASSMRMDAYSFEKFLSGYIFPATPPGVPTTGPLSTSPPSSENSFQKAESSFRKASQTNGFVGVRGASPDLPGASGPLAAPEAPLAVATGPGKRSSLIRPAQPEYGFKTQVSRITEEESGAEDGPPSPAGPAVQPPHALGGDGVLEEGDEEGQDGDGEAGETEEETGTEGGEGDGDGEGEGVERASSEHTVGPGRAGAVAEGLEEEEAAVGRTGSFAFASSDAAAAAVAAAAKTTSAAAAASAAAATKAVNGFTAAPINVAAEPSAVSSCAPEIASPFGRMSQQQIALPPRVPLSSGSFSGLLSRQQQQAQQAQAQQGQQGQGQQAAAAAAVPGDAAVARPPARRSFEQVGGDSSNRGRRSLEQAPQGGGGGGDAPAVTAASGFFRRDSSSSGMGFLSGRISIPIPGRQPSLESNASFLTGASPTTAAAAASALSGAHASVLDAGYAESVRSDFSRISVDSYPQVPYAFAKPSYPYVLPRVLYFRMGGGTGKKLASSGRLDHGGKWVDSLTWPLPFQTSPTTLYLHVDGKLSKTKPSEGGGSSPTSGGRGTGGLSGGGAAAAAAAAGSGANGVPAAADGAEKGPEQAAAAGARTFVHDPRSPVPTIGGNITSGEPIMSGGAYDQVERPDFFGCQQAGRALCDRADMLSFSTPTLDADIEVTGVGQAVLYFTSSCPDTDFAATLVDVYPPSEDYPQGFAMNAASGICRARFRSNQAPGAPPGDLLPGTVYCITVDLNVTSNLFVKGHKLRVDISSSSFPRYDLNYGLTAEERLLPEVPAIRTATNSVFCSSTHASHLLLPMRKLTAAASASAGAASTEPLIPFSSKWLKRQPTWSR